jgi:hypothetical protein
LLSKNADGFDPSSGLIKRINLQLGEEMVAKPATASLKWYLTL